MLKGKILYHICCNSVLNITVCIVFHGRLMKYKTVTPNFLNLQPEDFEAT
jgi:hypothetical protein